MGTIKSKHVIVFLSVNSENNDVIKNIRPWLNQDHSVYEIRIIDESAHRAPVLNKIAENNSNVSLISDNGTMPFNISSDTDSDYVIYANSNDYYPKNYISDMVNSIGSNSVCISNSAVLYPDKKEDIVNGAVLFSPKKSTNGTDFLRSNPNFWGIYFLGNKMISVGIFKKINDKIASLYLNSDYKHNLYLCHFIISVFLLTECGDIAFNEKSAVIVNWEDYDNKIKNHAADIFQTLNLMKKAFSLTDELFSSKNISADECKKIKDRFVERFWWRTNWILDNKDKASLKSRLTTEFSLDNIEYDSDFVMSECEISSCHLNKEEYLHSALSDTDEKKIHIYVSMHKPSYVPDNKYLIPIQVGAALADKRFENTLHDDEGENISAKNKRYCELTAQYWAWKNDLDADYYGFWHYRRYFCFNTDKKPDVWGNVDISMLTDRLIEEFDLREEDIQAALKYYDIIVPQDWVCDEGDGEMTVYQHWCKHFDPDDIQTMTDVIREKYPEYDKDVMSLLFSNSAPFCNLFIMNRALFQEYNEFCFTVLEEVEKRVNHENYNVERYRTMGHLAERLTGIFVKHIERTRKEVSILRLPTLLIRNTKPKALISPIVTDKKQVVLTLACDKNFVPYTSVLLQSIKEHTNDEYFYDIVLMHKDIPEEEQLKLSSIFFSSANVSLRFADVSRNFERHLDLHIDRHLSLETYFRFMILDIMPDYDKVLYLDCDMIVNRDIAELYFTDIGDKAIAATRDFDFIASYQEPERKKMYDEKIMKYIGISDVEEYFQAGVILFNMKKISEMYTVEDLFEKASSRSWYYHDQDVLNSLFAGNVYYLDPKWNVMTMLEPNSQRKKLFTDYLYARYAEAYNNARKNIGIVHFAGVPKPWHDTKCDLSMYFWEYAKRTPYYEQLSSTLNSGYFLPFGSVIFIGRHNVGENVGCELFDINMPNSVWSECYLTVDFIFLSDHYRQEITKSTLFIAASILPGETESSQIRVHRFKFDDCVYDYIFNDNISYRLVDSKTIRIMVRQTNQYEGFSWRVRELQSREIEKPTITILNEGFIADVNGL